MADVKANDAAVPGTSGESANNGLDKKKLKQPEEVRFKILETFLNLFSENEWFLELVTAGDPKQVYLNVDQIYKDSTDWDLSFSRQD